MPDEHGHQLVAAFLGVGIAGWQGNVFELLRMGLLQLAQQFAGMDVDLFELPPGSERRDQRFGLVGILGQRVAGVPEFLGPGNGVFDGLLLVVGCQGCFQGELNEIDHVAAKVQPDQEPGRQPQDRPPQTPTQLLEVLPEGHRGVFEKVFVAPSAHGGLTG